MWICPARDGNGIVSRVRWHHWDDCENDPPREGLDHMTALPRTPSLPYSPSLRLSVSPSPIPRRAFLADVGMGFTGVVLGSMLHRDGIARGDDAARWLPPDGHP